MKNLKSALLTPLLSVAECTLLGVPVHIRRLSALEISEYDEAIRSAREAGDMLEPARLSASFILRSLVDDQGKAIPQAQLPTTEELIAAQDNAALIKAVSTIQQHSYGTLEEAQKN
ncbi:phage tail protein [Salmonella enterica]|nr:phage tail protein [Salmonella enterica]